MRLHSFLFRFFEFILYARPSIGYFGLFFYSIHKDIMIYVDGLI